MHEDDRALVRSLRRGGDEAFRAFFDEYFPRLYRFCVRRLDDADAEEATQAALIAAVRRIETWRGEASLFTWLCQIARHEISAHLRRERRHRDVVRLDDGPEVRAELESLGADPELGTDAGSGRIEGQEVVQLILDHLPAGYGRVLEWKYMLELSVEEIAERLGTTPTAIQSMLARARRAFRRQYEAMNAEVVPITARMGEGRTS
jgi:RNA polymerase sigma-70 factor (ECF subfamily)